jgi:hypothetical protein
MNSDISDRTLAALKEVDMREIQGRPEEIKQLEKAVWCQVQNRPYWVINAETCYAIVQAEGHGFRARIIAEGSRLHSADLALWGTQAEACARVEEWLLGKRQLGICAVQGEDRQFTTQLCPIRQISFTAPAPESQPSQAPEAYSLC